MALLKDFTIPNTTVTVKKAYHRIDYVSGTKESMNYHVCVYTDEESYLIGHEPIGHQTHSFKLPLDQHGNLCEVDKAGNLLKNFFALAYDHLKGMTGYKNAKDA